jgi:hypothetical protein
MPNVLLHRYTERAFEITNFRCEVWSVLEATAICRSEYAYCRVSYPRDCKGAKLSQWFVDTRNV